MPDLGEEKPRVTKTSTKSLRLQETETVDKFSADEAVGHWDERVEVDAVQIETRDQDRVSEFLNVPIELRDQIYGYVLGGRMIHIACEWEDYISKLASKRQIQPSLRLDRYTCYPDEAEDFITLEITAERDGQSSQSEDHPSLKGCEHIAGKPDLNILRVCRQIYAEARLIPYTANTFSVSEGYVFNQLKRQILFDHFRSIRTIHLDVNLTSYVHAIQWTRIFNDPGLDASDASSSKVLNLHTLHVCFAVQRSVNFTSPWSIGLGPDFWITGFRRLQRRQLDRVTVSIATPEFSDFELIDVQIRRCCEAWGERLLQAPD